MKKTVALAGVLFIALIGVYFWYRESQYAVLIHTPVDLEAKERISFRVESGESVQSVAERLKDNELVPSSWAFYKYVKRMSKDKEIEAGRFVLQKSFTIPEIVDALTRSLKDEEAITIIEGLTIAQIDDYLAEKKVLADGAFEACAQLCSFDFPFLASRPQGASLEGYLFPDTYFVDPQNTSAEMLITRMLSNFQNRTSGLFDTSERTIHEIITMASIVEREENSNAERPNVAHILWKRFDSGVALGADATVRYALNKWTEPLYTSDLESNSPYNTRKFRGLPPGPIGNPGLASIKAALAPEENPYWYYLHDSEGKIHYGKTLEEHNTNKQKYL